MKWPTDPKERNQYIILAVMVTAAVGYLTWTFVITPTIATRKYRAGRIAELKELIEQAERKISQTRSFRDMAVTTAEKTLQMAEKHVLLPALGGNYLINAEEIIKSQAERAGVQLETIRQGATINLPRITGRAEANIFGAYTVNIVIKGSLDELARFIKVVEDDNPCISFTMLNINPQADDPQAHNCTMQFEWPVWVNDAARVEMKKDLENRGG